MKLQKNLLIQSNNLVGMLFHSYYFFFLYIFLDLQKTNFKWMKSTVLKSVILMHYQDRNIHGKVFGGHIIKSAFDLAFIAAVS